MKNTKKFAAMIAALTLSACSIAPAMVMNFTASAATHTINITPKDDAKHTYSAYQVFAGEYVSNVLTNVTWGVGVDGDALLAELKTDTTLKTYFDAATNAADVAEALGAVTTSEGEDGSSVSTKNFEDDSELTQAFAKIVEKHLTTTKQDFTASNNGKYTLTNVNDGYYFVKDSAAPVLEEGDSNSGAYTRYILKVAGDAEINVDAKSAAPTVDKQVLDETADAEKDHLEGWGESADHDMFEKFDFKLTANLPESTEYASYEKYKVVFTDTMSTGVSFSQIKSVTVDGQTLTTGYVVDGVTEGDAGKTWTLSIADVKTITGVDLTNGADIEVVYEAYLNENAIITTATGDYDKDNINNNKVKLNYSNNPAVSGEGSNAGGETPEDYVWVGTYESFNKKTNEDNEALGGAEFRLFSDAECTNEIKLIYDSEKGVYRPVKAGETAEVIKSAESTGTFNIVGLDSTTYYLKETKAPVGGYNLLTAAKPITITATHAENATGDKVTLNLGESNSSADNPMTIVNKKGSSLPSTGGIGTTLFYIGGGAMVAVAGVFLITKKRAGKSEN